MDSSSLALLPEREVRSLLRDRDVSLQLLRPPYPAVGLGMLRVLRVRERDGVTQVVAGYERYERLPA